jgi:hypothetical protein
LLDIIFLVIIKTKNLAFRINMPTEQELFKNVGPEWQKRFHGYFNIKKDHNKVDELYLYRTDDPHYQIEDDRKDYGNHIHIYFKRPQNKYVYNIKCFNDKGNDRKVFEIDSRQSVDDFIQEAYENWDDVCRKYLDGVENDSKKSKRQRYRERRLIFSYINNIWKRNIQDFTEERIYNHPDRGEDPNLLLYFKLNTPENEDFNNANYVQIYYDQGWVYKVRCNQKNSNPVPINLSFDDTLQDLGDEYVTQMYDAWNKCYRREKRKRNSRSRGRSRGRSRSRSRKRMKGGKTVKRK